jgi:N-acetylglucosamine-6-phosphate deacetylase
VTTLRGNLVLPDRVIEGWLEVNEGRIAAMGAGPARSSAVTDLGGGYLLPGLVDMHCHGGGGAGFDQGAAHAREAARFHAAAGTTSVVASIGTSTPDRLREHVTELASCVHDGTLVGLHLEGPYLNPRRCGAHRPDLLRLPDPGELEDVLAAADGTVAMVTLAPELAGGMSMVERLRAAAVRVAVGHTDATAAQTTAAFDAGATVATHLFNGMRPVHHREGGPVLAALQDRRVACELICDGHHVAADVCRLVFDVLEPGRLLLVTDACPAAGMPDGPYRLGGEEVVLHHGAVRTADGRSLAGSALTLLDAVRNVVSWSLPLPRAVRAASLDPATVLGLTDRGRLEPGLRADVVVTDEHLQVRAVMRDGSWL